MSEIDTESSAHGPVERATVAELSSELRAVITEGLPLMDAETGGLLLSLRSVFARAVIPSEPTSRLAALNELLPRLIASLGDPTYRDAVQILFGLAPGTRGSSLMARRRQAASVLGYSEGHFRDAKEAELLTAVATTVHDDLLRYRSRVKRATESLEPTGDTPRLGPEHLTHEEELISRIWQHVYGLRAELIACARLSEAEGFEAQAEDHRQAALANHAALQRLLREYVDSYGARIRHGETEFSVDALRRISGWST